MIRTRTRETPNNTPRVELRRSRSEHRLNSPDAVQQAELDAILLAPPPPAIDVDGEQGRVRDRSQARRRTTRVAGELDAFHRHDLRKLDTDELAWQIQQAQELLDELNNIRNRAPDPEKAGHQLKLEQSIFKSRRLLQRAEDAQRLSPAVNFEQTQTPNRTPQFQSYGTNFAHFGHPITRLPEIKIPSFSGATREWPCFWKMFSVAIDESTLSATEKLIYLKSLLSGEASTVIDGFEISDANYQPVKQALLRHYDRPGVRKQELVHLVSNPPTLDFKEVASTREKLFAY